MASAPLAAQPAPSRDLLPHSLAIAHQKTTTEILVEPLPQRRQRRHPRVIKRKMSNWGVKRPEHRNWPQPTKPAEEAIEVLAA